MPEDRERLRSTFDGAALLYDEVRPGYPEALFDEIVSISGIPFGGRILEVGCGTGQATLPLARRGYEILCVELGENLAALARRNLAGYPRVHVLTGDFEKIRLPEEASTSSFRPRHFTGSTRRSRTRRLPARYGPRAPQRCSGTSTYIRTKIRASSRRRRESTSVRRPRSGTKATKARPGPKTSRTGQERSRAPGCSAPSSDVLSGGIRPTTPLAISGFSTLTRTT
jgi:hypothetical protein